MKEIGSNSEMDARQSRNINYETAWKEQLVMTGNFYDFIDIRKIRSCLFTENMIQFENSSVVWCVGTDINKEEIGCKNGKIG